MRFPRTVNAEFFAEPPGAVRDVYKGSMEADGALLLCPTIVFISHLGISISKYLELSLFDVPGLRSSSRESRAVTWEQKDSSRFWTFPARLSRPTDAAQHEQGSEGEQPAECFPTLV